MKWILKWGLGIGPNPNPQSPIPNPQSPLLYFFRNIKKSKIKILEKLIIKYINSYLFII